MIIPGAAPNFLDMWFRLKFPIISGKYRTSPFVTGNYPGSHAIAANYHYFLPYIGMGESVDRMAFAAQATDAGYYVRLHLYDDNGLIYPGDLLWESAAIEVASTGLIYAAISPAVALPPGLYWMALISDHTPTLFDVWWGGGCQGFVWAADISGNYHYGGFIKSGTYGAAPDPFTSGVTGDLLTQGISGTPLMGLRVA